MFSAPKGYVEARGRTEFFSDFLKLFNECLFRNPVAIPGAVVGLGLA